MQHLQTAAIRIGIDVKVFDLLAAAKTPLNVTDITDATKADPVFIGWVFSSGFRHYGPDNLLRRSPLAQVSRCFWSDW